MDKQIKSIPKSKGNKDDVEFLIMERATKMQIGKNIRSIWNKSNTELIRCLTSSLSR